VSIKVRIILNKLQGVSRAFWHAKFADGGSILGLSQLTQLPQLPLKMTLDFNKVKIGSKINHLASLI